MINLATKGILAGKYSRVTRIITPLTALLSKKESTLVLSKKYNIQLTTMKQEPKLSTDISKQESTIDISLDKERTLDLRKEC
ncbi:MAG: hypothetical protein DRP09_13020 [Candidatus Thorarchaeota archaeon]|nr:MAG: hypothetical protein DRP09_13020 [Candidatus Thorarchaeota archaeon]